MSWRPTGVHGGMPTWTCDSCQAQKDKCCSLTMNVLGTYDAFSKMQSVVRRKGDQAELAALLSPMMSNIEHDCIHSSHNAVEKAPEAQERTFYVDHAKGCKVWSDGEITPLTQDEKDHFIEERNRERIRAFSPHIGQ